MPHVHEIAPYVLTISDLSPQIYNVENYEEGHVQTTEFYNSKLIYGFFPNNFLYEGRWSSLSK